MNKNQSNIIISVSVLIALVGIASGIKNGSAKKKAQAEVVELQAQISRMKAFVPQTDAPTETRYIEVDTNNVSSLVAKLQQTEAELIALKAASTNDAPRERQGGNRESFEERMTKMKEEDPEGYEKMIQERKDRQEQMKYNLAERTATFMDMDTSFMSEEELANHEQLIGNMAKIFEMTELFNDPETRPDRETMQELMETVRETRPLMTQERAIMFKQLGSDMGYEGDDAQAFADHVEDIISATSINMPGRGGRGGGRGR